MLNEVVPGVSQFDPGFMIWAIFNDLKVLLKQATYQNVSSRPYGFRQQVCFYLKTGIWKSKKLGDGKLWHQGGEGGIIWKKVTYITQQDNATFQISQPVNSQFCFARFHLLSKWSEFWPRDLV